LLLLLLLLVLVLLRFAPSVVRPRTNFFINWSGAVAHDLLTMRVARARVSSARC